MAFSLCTQAHSEIGLVRKNNQDSGYFSPTMLLVADGMGGAAAGDLASTVAVKAIEKADRRLQGEAMLEALAGTLAKANDQLADLVAHNHRLAGMGTTVTGVMFDGEQLGMVHIGDSRGYRLRDGKLEQLTRDHSWVQSLVDEGKISEEEAATHPHRSLLLKVLNGQPTHTPDVEMVDVQLGDRLMFCSDGLSGMVDDAQIARALAEPDLKIVLDELVQGAHAGGGTDNITIIVSDVVDYDEKLEALPPTLIGAATSVTIPDVPVASVDLDDDVDDENLDDLGNPVPRAPSPVADGLPPIPPDVIDPDAREAERYAPTIRARRRVWPLIVSLATGLALLTGSFFGGKAYLATQFFIGPDSDYIAIHSGVPDRPLGISLSELVETTQTRIDDLPPYYAKSVREQTIRPRDLNAAHATVAELDRKAKICIEQRKARAELPAPPGTTASPSPTMTGSATPDASKTPDSSATPESSASGGPTASASPSVTSRTPASAYSVTPTASPTINADDPEACS